MRKFHLYFYWEQLPTLGRMYILTSESATPTYDDTERAAIPADHNGMVRFESPKAAGFKLVMDASREAAEMLRALNVPHLLAMGVEVGLTLSGLALADR
ncbi:hypothetical protein B0H67DRAFT_645175 [Lasiosphaeris hirsuta]|uniref:Uncharacterized protein n=1 Tax=Lasiosphaeris hirsuta TaxID=260670 RepID=A0AA40AGI6_9PEZI|nr:hypothetical protein B0H67DRAFT_645175 [Lasiosphaeris hirsuta]